MQGSYTLAVSTAGFAVSVACPTTTPQAVAVLPDGGPADLDGAVTPGAAVVVLVQCTSTSFDLGWAGDQPLGTNAPNAAQIQVAATLTPTGGGTAPVTGTAAVATTGQSQPNGPSCGPTCYARQAVLGI